MAVSINNRLEIKFKDSAGKTLTKSFAHASDEATDEQVKALANGMVTNGAIYADVPTSVVSATLVSTTSTDYDIE